MPLSVIPGFARYLRCNRGVTAVEFAFVAPVIIAILLATVQIAVLYIAQSYLEEVTEEGMRVVLTNNAYTLTQSQFKTQVCANLTALFSCNNLIVQLQPINCNTPSAFAACMSGSLPQFDNNGNLVGQTTFNTGSANDKMLLVLMYQWPVIGGPLGLTLADPGLSTRLLVSTEVFYKEPCTNSQTNCKAS